MDSLNSAFKPDFRELIGSVAKKYCLHFDLAMLKIIMGVTSAFILLGFIYLGYLEPQLLPYLNFKFVNYEDFVEHHLILQHL